MKPIFYIRGLNSRGDDFLRLGALALGPMSGPLVREFSRHGFEVVAVEGFGGGPLHDQVARARDFILAHPLWRQDTLNLVGHSTGGLIARALMHELLDAPKRVRFVLTMATPHHGSPLAKAALEFPRTRPLVHRILRFQYDVKEKLATLADFRPEALDQFNQRYPNVPGVRYGSVVFKTPFENLSWPFRLLKMILGESDTRGEHDGIVEAKVQEWGERLFTSELDHLNQIGFFLQLKPNERLWAREKFRELVEGLVSHLK